MAISFVGEATDEPFNRTGIEPSGVASGDLLIAFVSSDEGALTAPAGWTQIQSTMNAGIHDTYASVWYHERGGSAPNLTWTGDGYVEFIYICAFRGVASVESSAVSSTGSLVAPSLTATKNSSWLIAANCDSGWETTNTAPTGMTKIADNSSWIICQETVSAGATGTRTFAAGPDPVATFSIILEPTSPPNNTGAFFQFF